MKSADPRSAGMRRLAGVNEIARAIFTAALALAAGVAAAAPSQFAVPAFDEVRAAHHPSDWLVTDRDGIPLQRVRRDNKVRREAWLALAEVSPTMQVALVTAEDKRFWSHTGVDWAAFAKAALDNLSGRNVAADGQTTVRGASTLTMQLAGMLDPELHPAPGQRRSFGQKWDQAQVAREIERTWSKPQILEAYLNLVSWRGETAGLAAASKAWFGKQPGGLDLTEAALLAALIRQPQAAPAKVGQRACAIIAALPAADLVATPRPDCEAAKLRATLVFSQKGAGGNANSVAPDLAFHAARRALQAWGERAAPAPARAGGEPILRTTLDARVQRLAVQSLNQNLRELAAQNVEDGAVIVLDNASGEVLAYVGSSGELSDAAQVDGVTAPRQAGSTLKPFLYSLAIEQRRLTAASLLSDSPLSMTAENGAYIPQDYDKHFKGWVSARVALASSLNVPAVRTLLLTGVDSYYARLQALGFSTLTESPDYYGLAMALGGAEVRLIDLANAYRALANHGQYQTVAALVPGIAPSAARAARDVINPGAAFIVADILSDRGARAPTFGLENALATRVWSAVKTGTSKDMRDNWCVGFTSRYTVAVWVGNFSGAPMWDVSGMHGAAPVWRDLIHALHEDEASRESSAPRSVVAHNIEFANLKEASRREYFLRGTELSLVERADSPDSPADPDIAYPGNGLIVALDPDIPQDLERIAFQMEPQRADYRWRLARTTGQACGLTMAADAIWQPQPGVWRLSLLNADNSEVAKVQFTVRGAARKGGETAEECD